MSARLSELQQRLVVRLATFDENYNVQSYGSGALVTEEGHILTAAHVLTGPDGSDPSSYCVQGVVVRGVECTCQRTSCCHWGYLAEVTTPPQVLYETTASPAGTRGSMTGLLDLAVLKITHTCNAILKEVDGSMLVRCDHATLCTHEFRCLDLCNEASSVLARVSHLGYPCNSVEQLANSSQLHGDTKAVSTVYEDQGLIVTEMTDVAYSGSSGGPLLNDAGQICGVLMYDTPHDESAYLDRNAEVDDVLTESNLAQLDTHHSPTFFECSSHSLMCIIDTNTRIDEVVSTRVASKVLVAFEHVRAPVSLGSENVLQRLVDISFCKLIKRSNFDILPGVTIFTTRNSPGQLQSTARSAGVSAGAYARSEPD